MRRKTKTRKIAPTERIPNVQKHINALKSIANRSFQRGMPEFGVICTIFFPSPRVETNGTTLSVWQEPSHGLSVLEISTEVKRVQRRKNVVWISQLNLDDMCRGFHKVLLTALGWCFFSFRQMLLCDLTSLPKSVANVPFVNDEAGDWEC
ncbi:hypothetical protein NPIL_648051 [Nephila pilipes]|uniref:Uncharacterized protein n=1 Tax=Nephila pilipes TaxID=299642 RepID=A0A8X6R4J3_NEPPI|nr:hypothetical protein NPIL_648051 [Nephila pilipes]